MDIDKIRKDTLNCENIIHFNNAGASLPPRIVNQAIKAFLTEEEYVGGYEMAAKHTEDINGIYTEIAKLIRSEVDEIAITDNASTAFSKALYAIPFSPDDEIITSEIEYSNNFLNYLKLKNDKGVQIITIPGNDQGPVDIELLKKSLSKKTKLVSITHMPTSSGAIAPVAEIGEITKNHGAFYMIDSCQSIGQYPTYVDEVHCDFLTATSRKYLRGPRGMGFLYANKNIYPKLDPYMLEAIGANWESEQKYELNYTSKMFECFEKPYATMMGFQEAIRYANELGIENIWKRIKSLAEFAREKFRNIEGVTIQDGPGHEWSGIITLTSNKNTSEEIHQHLQAHKVNSSICLPFTSLSDMNNKNIDSSNRLSLHYYNTKEEIERVAHILQNLK
ncbi:aminotransferase class V-fold PLP-dependent enzyme [Portibacter lacus]|uniref:Aminotransferase class V n=1 Tax=Portibacter lacus TaxID=1099794 RepID=A0AA37SKZ8_9BACT|nr:aminotransferase class V-fold PLP-dependent enzyme [Portibacter lacus]GLR15812.1 aminotransferase class V [Portibacter lacus]